MNCLLCIASIYFAGSMGIQNLDKDESYRSNDYGSVVGNLDLIVEFENNLFIKASHLSGVNTTEWDNGKNSIEVGGKIYLFKRGK